MFLIAFSTVSIFFFSFLSLSFLVNHVVTLQYTPLFDDYIFLFIFLSFSSRVIPQVFRLLYYSIGLRSPRLSDENELNIPQMSSYRASVKDFQYVVLLLGTNRR